MVFHRDAYGLPSFIERKIKVRYGGHSRFRAQEKNINLPTEIDINIQSVVEIDTSEQKYTVRISHDSVNDLVLVVKADGFVKTVWLNAKSDTHKTLNKNRYLRPAKELAVSF